MLALARYARVPRQFAFFPRTFNISYHDTILWLLERRSEMPQHDNRPRPGLDLAITMVFAIVLIAVLLWLRADERSYVLPSGTHQVVAPIPPM
jgi:hypothetical protein